MSEVTKEETDRLSREIDAHGEALKKAIERGACLKCHAKIETQLLPRAIRFQCGDYICGWSAIYPIRTIGNSERPQCTKYFVLWPDKKMGGFEREDVLMCALAENRSMGEAQIFKLTCTLPTIYEPIDSAEVREIAFPDEAKLQQAMRSTEHLQEIRKLV